MAGRLFSSGTQVSPTNKTDRHDITEILLKVALNTITLTLMFVFCILHRVLDYILKNKHSFNYSWFLAGTVALTFFFLLWTIGLKKRQ